MLKSSLNSRLHLSAWSLFKIACSWVTGLFVLVALLTYSQSDPGWTHTGSGRPILNGGGMVGASLADGLLALFGPIVYLLPLYLLVLPLRGLQSEKEREGLFWWPPLRWVSLMLALAAGSALAWLHFRLPSELLRNAAGGIIGDIIAGAGFHLLGLWGCTLLFLTCFLIGFSVAFAVDWLLLAEWLGKPLWALAETLCHQVDTVVSRHWQEWKNRRHLRREFNQREDAFALHISNKKVKAQIDTPAKKAPQEPRVEPQLNMTAPDLSVAEVPRPAVLKEKKKLEARRVPEIHALEPAAPTSQRVERERQRGLFDQMPTGAGLPQIALLDEPEQNRRRGYSTETLEALSRLLELKLREFNVDAAVVAVHPGPVITRFEIQPAPGVKVARISNIAKDLARSLAVVSVRVVEVIPGKSVVGIEIPNENREMVRLSEVLSSVEYDSKESPITLALGKDIGGKPVVADLAKMPHLLVAGTTGSGKSVGVNAMLLSVLFKSTPDQVRMIMIDPKMLELSVYDGIPHLLTPVVTDMKEAANALRWSVGEMERRYKLMASLGVRNLSGFNKKVEDAIKAGTPIPDPLWKPQDTALQEEPPTLTKLPYIVVVVDEFADMMMVVGKKVEELIARIAQKARAAGIHLILATQRPSVDVITGLIKANIPTRIAFQVSSKIDSRTILDQGGAEQLLGQGDMLYLPPGTSLPERVHGAFVADEEVHRVCDHWRAFGPADYIEEILEGTYEVGDGGRGSFDDEDGGDAEQDALYDQAVAFVMETRRPSISYVQRKFKIGYNRAARLIEAMEAAGVVSSMQTNGQREVLVPNRE